MENQFFYILLDWFFIVFHSILLIFNLLGWIWKPLRRINFITLLLTGLSWVGLGIFYGKGYCPLTDWHWRILMNLGRTPNTNSYIAYLIDRALGVNITDTFADKLTLIGFLMALALSSILNIRDYFRKP